MNNNNHHHNSTLCVSVCPQAYLWNRSTDPHEMFYADFLWPWLGAHVATLQYVMYFRFVGDVTIVRSGLYCDTWKAEPLTYYH